VEAKPGPISDERVFSFSVISPLRYPGAKRQLVPIIEQVVTGNIPPPRLFVEPFCGGASTALRLVGTGVVEHAILADADDLVHAFWYTAVFDTAWLINQVMSMEVTVAQWEWFRIFEPKGRRDKALKCFFLNRTTFSGILHGRAGPIGGKKQDAQTKYKIDCRFNKEALSARLKAIGELGNAGRILDVWDSDWRDTLRRVSKEYGHRLTPDEILLYLDPPYVDKAEFLYQWAFDDDEHRALAAALSGATDYRWILSYDDNPLARLLYPAQSGNRHVLHARHRYSAAGLRATTAGKRTRPQREELLVTNFLDIPASDAYHALGELGCDACQAQVDTDGGGAPPQLD
jgi:DNA adenine methylase